MMIGATLIFQPVVHAVRAQGEKEKVRVIETRPIDLEQVRRDTMRIVVEMRDYAEQIKEKDAERQKKLSVREMKSSKRDAAEPKSTPAPPTAYIIEVVPTQPNHGGLLDKPTHWLFDSWGVGHKQK